MGLQCHCEMFPWKVKEDCAKRGHLVLGLTCPLHRFVQINPCLGRLTLFIPSPP